MAAARQRVRAGRALENLYQSNHHQQQRQGAAEPDYAHAVEQELKSQGQQDGRPHQSAPATAHAIKSWRNFAYQAEASHQQQAANANEHERPDAVGAEIPDVEGMQQEDHAQSDEHQGAHRDFAGVQLLTGAEGCSQSKRVGRLQSQLQGTARCARNR